MTQPSRRVSVWVLRTVFFVTALACVYFLGGGTWFYAGLCLGWVWAVLEVAAQRRPYPEFPDEAEYDGQGAGPVGF